MDRGFKGLKRKKKGISALLGGIILFSIIFSTGTAYFLFTFQSQQGLQIANYERMEMGAEQNIEDFFVVGEINGTSYLRTVVNNTGPIPIQIVYRFVIDSNNVILEDDDFTSNPITVNPLGSAEIPTSIQYFGGDYTLKIVSRRGTLVANTYPLSTFNSAEISAGFGSIRLDFKSFRYFFYGGSYDLITNYPTGTSASDSPANIDLAY
ncbi:MAG: hypothetical protein ACW99Q_24730, partial [Candidatus Kariarchaeaceae archaeon]